MKRKQGFRRTQSLAQMKLAFFRDERSGHHAEAGAAAPVVRKRRQRKPLKDLWSVTDAVDEMFGPSVSSGLHKLLIPSIKTYWGAHYRALVMHVFGRRVRSASRLYYRVSARHAFDHFCDDYFRGKAQRYVNLLVKRGTLTRSDAQLLLAAITQLYPRAD